MFKKKKDLTEQTPVSDFESTVSGVEPVVKKKKGRKIAVISGISAAVLIGGGAAAYNLSPLVKNQVKLRTMKPENYYAWVNSENAETFAKKVREQYEKALDKYEDGTTASAVLKYSSTDTAKEWAIDEMFGDMTIEDEEDQVLYDLIENLDSLAVNLDVQSANRKSLVSCGLDMNDDRLFSYDLCIDTINLDYFMRIPELSEKWMGFSLGDILNDSANDFYTIYQDILANPADYLSPAELEKEILRYTDLWNSCVENVRIEKSEEIGICDIDVKYTVASVKIDGDLQYELSQKLLEEIRDDEIIRNIVVNKLGIMDEDDYIDGLNEALEDDKEDYDDGYYDDSESVTFKTYIDARGDIRGFEIKESSDDKFIFAVGKEKDDIRGEISLFSDGEREFGVDLSAQESSKNKYSGSIDISISDREYNFDTYEYEDVTKSMSLEFDDFEIVNKDKHYFNADVTLDIPDIDLIKLSFTADDSSQTVSYDIMIDDEDYGSVSLTYSSSEGADFEVPDKSDSFMIDLYGNETPDFTQYVSKEETEKFMSALLEKIGFDKEISEEAAKAAVEEMYDDLDDSFGGYDDDFGYFYDDDDWDDYDWDDDDWDYDYDYDWDDYDWDYDYDYDYDNDGSSKFQYNSGFDWDDADFGTQSLI